MVLGYFGRVLGLEELGFVQIGGFELLLVVLG